MSVQVKACNFSKSHHYLDKNEAMKVSCLKCDMEFAMKTEKKPENIKYIWE